MELAFVSTIVRRTTRQHTGENVTNDDVTISRRLRPQLPNVTSATYCASWHSPVVRLAARRCARRRRLAHSLRSMHDTTLSRAGHSSGENEFPRVPRHMSSTRLQHLKRTQHSLGTPIRIPRRTCHVQPVHVSIANRIETLRSSSSAHRKTGRTHCAKVLPPIQRHDATFMATLPPPI